jgi:hypothetical protein
MKRELSLESIQLNDPSFAGTKVIKTETPKKKSTQSIQSSKPQKSTPSKVQERRVPQNQRDTVQKTETDASQSSTSDISHVHESSPSHDKHHTQPLVSEIFCYDDYSDCEEAKASPSISCGSINQLDYLSKNPWSFKARCVLKSNLRNYTGKSGTTGYAYSLDFKDKSGEIRLTGFDMMQIYDSVSIDKIYIVSNGAFKPSQKKFNSLNNEYEITATFETQIRQIAEDDDDIPSIGSLLELIQIKNLHQSDKENLKDTHVDIIGAVLNLGKVVTKESSSKKAYKTQTVTIFDDSRHSLDITFWGDYISIMNLKVNSIILLKSLKLAYYQGVLTGSVTCNTMCVKDPTFITNDKVKRFSRWLSGMKTLPKLKNISAKDGENQILKVEE